MDYDAEYRNNFTANSHKIQIRPWLFLMSMIYSKGCLKIDSYTTTDNAILSIEGNNDEDIVFNGAVRISKNVTHYGNITCKHIIFRNGTTCIMSKLNVSSISFKEEGEIIFSHNDKIMALDCGCQIKKEMIDQYLPGLTINFDHRINNSNGLMCIITATDEPASMILNMQHEYSYPLIESGILGDSYSYFGDTTLFIINVYDRSYFSMAIFLMRVTDFIKEQESKAKLLKNAYCTD